MGAIYQADIFCDDCAREIKRDLSANGFVSKLNAEGADIHDEHTYDSDDYPKYCDEQSEADCPQHCAGCGEFLENALTSDGYDYVRDTVKRDIADGHKDSIACTVWAPYYDIETENPNSDYLDGMACPDCGQWDEFIIHVSGYVIVDDDGIQEDADYEWSNDSHCECRKCGFKGKVRDFK